MAQRGLSCRRCSASSPREQLPAGPSSRTEAGGTPQAPAFPVVPAPWPLSRPLLAPPGLLRPLPASPGLSRPLPASPGLPRPPVTASVLLGRGLLGPDSRFLLPLEVFLSSPSLLPPLAVQLRGETPTRVTDGKPDVPQPQ